MNSKVFPKPKPLIGVLQLLPLPGSLEWNGRIDQVIARAEQEATALATGGVDGILVENTFDAPYVSGRMDTAGAVAMGLIIRRIMHFTHLPIGINILRNDPETALAIAMNVGAKFIRVNLLTGAAVCETGIIEGKYRDLMAYRQKLHAEGIAVFADVSLEKHLPLGGWQENPVANLKSLARQAQDPGGADGIILTDTQMTPETLREISQSLDIPVYYDYPFSLSEVKPYLENSDGLIVANSIKKSSVITQELKPTVDLTKVEELAAMVDLVRTHPAGSSV